MIQKQAQYKLKTVTVDNYEVIVDIVRKNYVPDCFMFIDNIKLQTDRHAKLKKSVKETYLKNSPPWLKPSKSSSRSSVVDSYKSDSKGTPLRKSKIAKQSLVSFSESLYSDNPSAIKFPLASSKS